MRISESTGYYHVCTDGHSLEWIFKDDLDFIAGVNRIGICKLKSKVGIISFVLMDNHVHFILKGSMPSCKDFITRYKALTGKWISSRYNIQKHLKHLPTQIIHITSEEQLIETIAYLDRNPIVAGYKCIPSEYPWGSAKHLFKYRDSINDKSVAECGARGIRESLKTRVRIPKEWTMNNDGMIDPRHFLEIEEAENRFKSPIRYIYYLSKKLEGKIELEIGTKSFIPDKELRDIVAKLVEEAFEGRTIKDLDFNSRIIIGRKLRYEYAASVKQISRMVHLDLERLQLFI